MPDSLTLSSIVIDFLALVGVVIYAWQRGRRGFCEVFSELLAFASSLLLSLFLYHPVARPLLWLGLSRTVAVPVAFLSLWFLLDILLSGLILAAGRYFTVRCRAVLVDRLLGYAFALLDGAVFVTVIVVVVWTAPLQPIARAKLIHSRVAGSLIRVVAEVDQAASSLLGGGNSMVFVSVGGDDREAISLTFTEDKLVVDTGAEEDLLWKVNAERGVAGISPLQVDGRLVQAARDHAADMLRRGYLGHFTPEGLSPADRAAASGTVFFLIAENIAASRDVEDAFRGFMASRRHRENVMSQALTRTGIGVIDAGRHGLVFVQLFAD